MVVLILALFGTLSYINIGQDLIPDLEFPVMAVVTNYSGVKSDQIEKLLTQPLEELLSTLDRIKRVTSTSQEGMSVILAEFEWGTDINQSVADTRAKIEQIKVFLPDDADDPIVLKFDLTQMPVVAYAVTGLEDGYRLRKYIDDILAPQLGQVDGVAMVMAQSGDVREIRIEVDAGALGALGLTLSDVMRAVQAENIDTTGGNLRLGPVENLITVKGEFRTVKEIEDVTVAVRPGRTVRIKDVARVLDDFREQRNRVRCNNVSPTVFFAVLKQSGANTARTSVLATRKIEEIRQQLPPEIVFHKVMDMGEMITRITSRTWDNAVMGALLAIVFVWLFIRNWRPTLIIFLAIPIAALTAFIGMYLLDYTFNLMTLGGLALGVGMLIDNAVVVVENTYRHLEMGKTRARASVDGGSEVSTAITASTLTTIAVFIPMVLVAGLASRMARPLAFTIVLALCASLFVALTIVPAMTSTLFRRRTREEIDAAARKFVLLSRVQTGYRAALDFLVDRGWLVLLVVLGLIGGAIVISYNMGGEFLPASDRPFIVLNAELPIGSTLDETDAALRPVENYAMEHSRELGIKAVFTSMGTFQDDPYASAQGFNPTDVNGGIFMIALEYFGEGRNVRVSEVEDRLRKVLPKLEVEGVRMEFSDPFGGMTSTSGEQAPIVIKVFGDDLEFLTRTAHRVRDAIADVRGVVDAKVSFSEGKSEQAIRVRRDLAAQYGLTTAQVAAEVRAALDGRVIGRFRESGEEFDIRVRLEPGGRDRIEKLLDLAITTPGGVILPLRQVVEVDESSGPLKITRENRRRKVSVTANIVGRDLVGTVEEIRGKLAPLNAELVKQGSYLSYGGTYEDYKDTVNAMAWAFAAAVLLVYMVMAAQFESLVHPLVVMMTVPIGIVGVVLGLALTGKTLSLPSMIGFVILVGIVVNNAIVMIDYVNILRRHGGQERRQAIIDGAVTRLRPILITSLTTIAGMAPMAFSQTQGSEMRSPMAIAVSSGLLFGMLLTLFVVPTAYNYFDRWADSVKAFLAGILYKGEAPHNETPAEKA